MTRITGFHPGYPGSIPGQGIKCSLHICAHSCLSKISLWSLCCGFFHRQLSKRQLTFSKPTRDKFLQQDGQLHLIQCDHVHMITDRPSSWPYSTKQRPVTGPTHAQEEGYRRTWVWGGAGSWTHLGIWAQHREVLFPVHWAFAHMSLWSLPSKTETSRNSNVAVLVISGCFKHSRMELVHFLL